MVLIIPTTALYKYKCILYYNDMENIEMQKTFIDADDNYILGMLLHIINEVGINSMFFETDIPDVKIEIKAGGGENLYGYLMRNIGKDEEDWRVYTSIKDVEPAFSRLDVGQALLALHSWISKLNIKQIGFVGTVEQVDGPRARHKIGVAHPY